jgi:hypothetical protein
VAPGFLRPAKAKEGEYQRDRTTQRASGRGRRVASQLFFANPNFIDLFSGHRARSHALPRMFAAGLRDTLSFGHVYAATREVGSSTRDQLAGVAVWLPPGAFPLSAARQLRAPPDMASAPRSARRLPYSCASAELVRARETERVLRKLVLSRDQAEDVERVCRSLVEKLVHGPIAKVAAIIERAGESAAGREA